MFAACSVLLRTLELEIPPLLLMLMSRTNRLDETQEDLIISERTPTTNRSVETLLAAECKESSRTEVKKTQLLDDKESDSRKSRERLSTVHSHSKHFKKEQSSTRLSFLTGIRTVTLGEHYLPHALFCYGLWSWRYLRS